MFEPSEKDESIA